MSDKSDAVVSHMAASVQAMSSASAAAESLLNQTSQHIRDTVSNVDSSNQDDVDECLDQLESFADQLDQRATELAAAVTANTPADPAAGSAGATAAGTPTDTSQSQGAGDVSDPHSVAGAAAAGGYPVSSSAPPSDQAELPPAAGQHPDQPIDETKGQNSTLTDTQPGGPKDQNADGSNADQSAGSGNDGSSADSGSGSDTSSSSSSSDSSSGGDTTTDDTASGGNQSEASAPENNG